MAPCLCVSRTLNLGEHLAPCFLFLLNTGEDFSFIFHFGTQNKSSPLNSSVTLGELCNLSVPPCTLAEDGLVPTLLDV